MSCDCDETADIWVEVKRRARKVHRCSECRGEIKKGETYTRISSLYDGRWTTSKQCEDCTVIVCDLGKAFSENGMCRGFCYCQRRLMQEMCDDADGAQTKYLHALLPIYCAFNAASKCRGGRLLPIEELFHRILPIQNATTTENRDNSIPSDA